MPSPISLLVPSPPLHPPDHSQSSPASSHTPSPLHQTSPTRHQRRPCPPSASRNPFSDSPSSPRYRLFISTLIIASNVACDNTYSNKSQKCACTVPQQYLKWKIAVDTSDFEASVKRDFKGPGPYPA
jgi:hypothetical protein